MLTRLPFNFIFIRSRATAGAAVCRAGGAGSNRSSARSCRGKASVLGLGPLLQPLEDAVVFVCQPCHQPLELGYLAVRADALALPSGIIERG